MNPDEVRSLIEGRTLSVPYTIHTRGGLSYPITDHSNAFIAAAYPNTLWVAVAGKGILHLGLGAIDSIRSEHEDGR